MGHPDDEALQSALAECLAAFASKGLDGLEAVLAEHPERADVLRARMDELVRLESRCCSFLTFSIHASPALTLRLTGSQDAKRFLTSEFGLGSAQHPLRTKRGRFPVSQCPSNLYSPRYFPAFVDPFVLEPGIETLGHLGHQDRHG